jgi:hypothetical protein
MDTVYSRNLSLFPPCPQASEVMLRSISLYQLNKIWAWGPTDICGQVGGHRWLGQKSKRLRAVHCFKNLQPLMSICFWVLVCVLHKCYELLFRSLTELAAYNSKHRPSIPVIYFNSPFGRIVFFYGMLSIDEMFSLFESVQSSRRPHPGVTLYFTPH